MATIVNQDTIAEYEQQVSQGVIDAEPYDRLMIYYRKQKDYKKELQIINRAIKIFSDQLKKAQQQLFSGKKSRASVKQLSDKINRSMGLIDKKGNHAYVPEPIAKWMKRKLLVEQKIKKEKS